MNAVLPTLLTALRAIAEPTRLRLVALCRTGDLTVTDICRILGQSQPRISRHLRLLVDAGVLEKIPEGSCVFHRLTRTGVGAEVARQISSILPENEDSLCHDQSRLAQIRHEREAKASEYFNENAHQWDSLRTMHVDDTEVETELLAMLGDDRVGDVLDIGTGTGRMLEVLAPRCSQAEGIDTSRSMLGIARARLDKLALENCRVRQGDMYELPFDGESFDTILFHQVLHYADDPEFAVTEAVRVLRPGGRLLITDFEPHDVEELRHKHAHRRLGFPAEEVEGWLSKALLRQQSHRTLKGDPLTVSLWMAEKPRRSVQGKRHSNESDTSASHNAH